MILTAAIFLFGLIHGFSLHQWWDYLTTAVTGCTVALLIIPTPDIFAGLFMLPTPPRAYVIGYNLVRYIAHLDPRAGWQSARGVKNGRGANGGSI